MTVLPVVIGLQFLDGMESYHGVASTSPDKCTKLGDVASYIMADMQGNIGSMSFAPIAITGAGCAAALGTSDPVAISFFNGIAAYLMVAFVGTAAGGLLLPMDPDMAFDQGKAACSVEINDENALRILCSALIGGLNLVTVVPAVPPLPIVIVSIS